MFQSYQTRMQKSRLSLRNCGFTLLLSKSDCPVGRIRNTEARWELTAEDYKCGESTLRPVSCVFSGANLDAAK